jgi:hypothetical protein
MIMKKRKKGMSHVEIIVSFVIFLGFLVFIFSVLNPFKTLDRKDIYFDVIEEGIKNYTSTKFDFLTINLNENVGGCFYIDYSLGKVIVKNESYDFVDAKSDGGKVYIKGSGEFYYIYSCEEFEDKSLINEKECIKMEEMNYTFGLFRSYNMTSNKSLIKLKNEYETNYRQLKRKLGVPETEDFLFRVRNMTGQEILNVTKNIVRGAKVSTRGVPIQIVYNDGTLEYAILNIQKW